MLLGAFASAMFLYGISLIYGITGSTYYGEIAAGLRERHRATSQWALLMGLVLIVAGLGFKVAAVPFHMWTPDAYEGAPVADHGVPLDDVEGGGLRAAAAALQRRVPGRARRLAAG